MSQATNKAYRLPTEAEWEYACRAGTTTPFHFGETATSDLVNCNCNFTYGLGSKGIYRQQTTEVGSFHPNAFGLYDMHGNVLEWCEDTWNENYEGAPTHGCAWYGSNDDYHIIRGGSWNSLLRYCRSASRIHFNPDFTVASVGFRVVCSAFKPLQ
ncbi:formylglycine-generating enzyme family protein (plasmid) [Acaryochloris sp. 'Moss Beach']|nr:formylglycine-generating enzyme family protein [Acaryochloris sp. 'Moss Beach']